MCARRSTDLGIRYPVALDNDYKLWSALDNHYWPAHYFIDAAGRVRYHHFGEGGYAQSERVIRQLLAEAGHAPKGGGMARADAPTAPKRPRRSARCDRPKPISALPGRSGSSRPAA